jgi:hypothetical protein
MMYLCRRPGRLLLPAFVLAATLLNAGCQGMAGGSPASGASVPGAGSPAEGQMAQCLKYASHDTCEDQFWGGD